MKESLRQAYKNIPDKRNNERHRLTVHANNCQRNKQRDNIHHSLYNKPSGYTKLIYRRSFQGTCDRRENSRRGIFSKEVAYNDHNNRQCSLYDDSNNRTTTQAHDLSTGKSRELLMCVYGQWTLYNFFSRIQVQFVVFVGNQRSAV